MSEWERITSRGRLVYEKPGRNDDLIQRANEFLAAGFDPHTDSPKQVLSEADDIIRRLLAAMAGEGDDQ